MSETTLFLSRACLRRDAPAAALRALLVPRGHGARTGAGHRLVWTLFADELERTRDFLWREADAGMFYLLSRRPPQDHLRLFDLDPPKPFAPDLRMGDRLAFSLRANATVARGDGTGRRGKPCDVVMNAIRAVPRAARAAARAEAVEAAGLRWLESQGTRRGFAIVRGRSGEDRPAQRPILSVTGYRTVRIEHAGPDARVGILDFVGELEVLEPHLFLQSVAQGFGRAKAFGCGLMLLRRA